MATDRVVESNDANGKVLLSASHVYDLTENKSQAEVNSQLKNTLNQLDEEKADEASLAYRRSGTTNTGAQIEIGTYFYLDGTLKKAIATIAQNAPFTAQNCETVTAGGLNSLELKTSANIFGASVDISGATQSSPYIFPSDGYVDLWANNGGYYRARIIDAYASTETTGHWIDAAGQAAVGNYYEMKNIFVRKGMGFRVITVTGTCGCEFRPLHN